MILITGATGHLGQATIDHLLNKIPAGNIAALVRDENKASGLKAKGIIIRKGDYTDKAALVAAMKGVDKLLLISSSEMQDRFGQHRNVIDAAAEAGVRHIYYTGVTLKDIAQSALKPFLESHYQTEDYIRSKGFTYTFLQNGLYAEVIPVFAGEKMIDTGIFLPTGSGKVAFATRQDLAAAAAAALTGEGHENKTYRLTGSESFSFGDIANYLSELSGKEVAYTSPDDATFKATLAQWGLPDEIIQLSAAFAAGMRNNEFDVITTDLEELIGRKPTSLRSFLNHTFAAAN